MASSETSYPRYVYSPFPAADCIRLLTIHPSLADQPIKCTLHSTSLASAPPYEALSYAWGPRALCRTVICNDHSSVSITENLYIALRQLSYSDRRRTVWIDGVCINQDDADERKAQVQMMWDIYSSASGVIVSLGQELPEDSMNMAWNLVHDLAKLHATKVEMHRQAVRDRYGRDHAAPLISLDVRRELDLESGGSPEVVLNAVPTRYLECIPNEEQLDGELPSVDSPPWTALRNLLQRTWFTRAWVLQEVVASKQCNVICGKRTISWETLTAACTCLRERQDIPLFQQSVRKADYMTVLSASLAKDCGPEERPPLIEILTASRSLESSDSRDKIYSLLGIIQHKGKTSDESQPTTIIPDYTIPVKKLFTEVARLAILQTKTLEILSHVGRRPNQKADELPAWVPDWRHEIPCLVMGRLNSENKFQYDACGQSARRRRFEDGSFRHFPHSFNMLDRDQSNPLPPFEPSEESTFSWDNSQLHLTGISFDRVSATSTDLFICDAYQQHHISDTDDSVYRPFWAAVEQFVSDNKVRYAPHSFENSEFEMMQDFYLRTVCANLDISSSFGPGGQGWYYQISYIPPSYSGTRTGDTWLEVRTELNTATWALMQRMRTERCLFATERGYIGIGPSWAEVGDKISIMSGGSVPLLIRESGTNGAGEPLHKLVGECYVHGIMNGEAVEMARIESLQSQEFVVM